MVDTYDYIIVGSGAGGSVVANRLTEDEAATVLLLEAGPSEMSDAMAVPWRWNEMLLGLYDWGYNSVPQSGLNGHNVYSAAGRGTGGGSILYHMMHVRAKPADLAGWVDGGARGWGWNECLPYYQKSENQTDETNPTAGRGGPMDVMNARETGSTISQTFIDACVELGYPEIADLNHDSAGAAWQHVNIKDGKRGGVLTSYLEPALQRPNLTLHANSRATRLLFEGSRCVGVEFVRDGALHTARATTEVVLSAGAIESPKLLNLSGIGNAEHLAALGIPVAVELPGVGENFQDHPLVIGPIGRLDRPGADPRGQMTEASLFWRSSEDQPVPDVEVSLVHRAPFGDDFFKNIVARIQTGEPVAPVSDLVDPNVILSLPSLIRPMSRGSVRIKSSDFTVSSDLDPNYCGESTDIERLTDIVGIARDIYASQAFAGLGLQELSPGPTVTDRPALRDWVRNNAGSYYHFVGSCKIGVDDMAVVDAELNVRGTDGLRIVDGSVMPTIPAANTHATVVMIAERGADMIKAKAASA
jgi:choline dehydrogenase